MPNLNDVAGTLVQDGRGILAADESIKTMSARLSAEGVEATERSRREYRELLITAPGLSAAISGVILCDETFWQRTSAGEPIPDACRDRGILPGIKVDTGVSPLAFGGGATITEGLDQLGTRLARYAANGAAFAKWRAVIDIRNCSDYSMFANAHALGRYAALCQEHGIVPIVEPEVLCDGSHDIDTCAVTTERMLEALFDQLDRNRVALDAMVLKPNMVTSGLDGPPVSAETVASVTLGVLGSFIPRAVPGIAFLSGGHSNAVACEYLEAINQVGATAAWSLTFSFGRALVSGALRAWRGDPAKVDSAHEVLLDNCTRAAAASVRRPLASRG